MIKPALITLITFFVFPFHAFACTIFTVKTEHTTYYCNHEDYWEYDTRLWITPGKDGKYGGIFYGFDDWRQASLRESFGKKPDLMVDNFFPDGGMNEKGLSWDWVANSTVWGSDPNKPEYRKSHVFHDIIQQYSTVDEAIAFIDKHNINGVGQTLMSDNFGTSAIIYKQNGKLIVERSKKNYQILGYGERTSASAMLEMSGNIDIKQIAKILKASQQGDINQYSTINDPKNKIVYLFHFQNFDEFIKIDMQKEFELGARSYSIPYLFSRIKVQPPTIVRNAGSVSVTFKWQGKPESIYKLIYSTDQKFDEYEAVNCGDFPAHFSNYAFLGFCIPACLLFAGIKRKRKHILKLSLLVCLLLNNSCTIKQRPEYVRYKQTLPKFETEHFSKTIDHLQPGTTYYWKIAAHPKGNDHFLSETFAHSFVAE